MSSNFQKAEKHEIQTTVSGLTPCLEKEAQEHQHSLQLAVTTALLSEHSHASQLPSCHHLNTESVRKHEPSPSPSSYPHCLRRHTAQERSCPPKLDVSRPQVQQQTLVTKELTFHLNSAVLDKYTKLQQPSSRMCNQCKETEESGKQFHQSTLQNYTCSSLFPVSTGEAVMPSQIKSRLSAKVHQNIQSSKQWPNLQSSSTGAVQHHAVSLSKKFQPGTSPCHKVPVDRFPLHAYCHTRNMPPSTTPASETTFLSSILEEWQLYPLDVSKWKSKIPLVKMGSLAKRCRPSLRRITP